MKDLAFDSSHFGINDFDFWFHRRPLQELRIMYETGSNLMSNLGVHWDRVHLPGVFSWNVMEKKKGTYDFTIPDLLVKSAEERNICLFPNLWPYAAWDQETYSKTADRQVVDVGLGSGARVAVDASYPIPRRYGKPHDMDAYARWVSAVVERYDGDGVDDMHGLKYPIKHWEIVGGYKAIVPFFFVGSPQDYTDLLKVSHRTAKSADPDCKIAHAATASLSRFLVDPEMDFSRDKEVAFFEDTLNLGCGDYFDILTIQTDGLDKATTRRVIEFFKLILLEHGYDKPIWITEIATHCGSGEFMDSQLPSQTPQEQSAGLVKKLTIALSYGVERVFWTALGSIIPANVKLTEPVESVGYIDLVSLLDNKGRPRPAYYTYQLMISMLDSFSSVKPLELGDEVEAFEFDTERGVVYVLWSEHNKEAVLSGLKEERMEITESVPQVNAQGYALLGYDGSPKFSRSAVPVVNGRVTLTVDSNPVFVRASR